MIHVSRTHRVALDWLFDRINLDPKIQIKYIDTKNQIADILTKKISHVMSGTMFLIVQHKPFQFHQLSWSDVEKNTRKKMQVKKESQEKSKPMTKLDIVMSFKGSDRACLDCIWKPGELQIWKPESTSDLVECAANRYGKPVMLASSSNFFWKCQNDNKWSSQVRKSVGVSNTSTEGPVYDKFVIDDDMDSDLTPPQNRTFSLKSRSWLNRVNGRFRKMLNRSPEDAMQDIDKRFMIWWRLMSSTLEASVFKRKNYSDNWQSIKKYWANFNVRQMFEISEQLILEKSDGIWVSLISWESSPWKQLSLVNDEQVISLSHAKAYVFSDSVLCLGKMNQNPASNTVWERQLERFKDSSHNTVLGSVDGEPLKFKWNDFPGFSTLELVREVQKFMSNMGELKQCQGWIIFMSMFNDIIWWNEDNETECMLIPHLYIYSHKDFHQDVGHSTDGAQKQSGIPLTKKDLEENGIEPLNWWWSNSEKADTQFSEQRVRPLEDCSKANEVENYRYTSVPMEIRLKLVFAQIFLSINSVSAEQSQTCVKSTVVVEQAQGDSWGRTIRPIFRASRLVDNDTLTRLRFFHKKIYCRCRRERVEKIPQPDQLIKNCIDAGFLQTVKVGQYFMTKHTEEFLQFEELVTCREYTLPRDDKSTEP